MLSALGTADTARGVITPSAAISTGAMPTVTMTVRSVIICFVFAERANGMGVVKYVGVFAHLRISFVRKCVTLLTGLSMTSTASFPRTVLNAIIIHCSRNGYGTSNDA